MTRVVVVSVDLADFALKTVAVVSVVAVVVVFVDAQRDVVVA